MPLVLITNLKTLYSKTSYKQQLLPGFWLLHYNGYRLTAAQTIRRFKATGKQLFFVYLRFSLKKIYTQKTMFFVKYKPPTTVLNSLF
jgi:hypothetical protein